jgi:hypothetical protein
MVNTPDDILVMLVLDDKIVKDAYNDQASDVCKSTTTTKNATFGVFNNDTGRLSFPHLSQSQSIIGNVDKFSWRFNSMAFSGSCCPQQSALFDSVFAKMSNVKFVFTRLRPTACKGIEYRKCASDILKTSTIQQWMSNMVHLDEFICLFTGGCDCDDTSDVLWYTSDASMMGIKSGRTPSSKVGCSHPSAVCTPELIAEGATGTQWPTCDAVDDTVEVVVS